MLVTCRELNSLSAVSQVFSELQCGSNYSCLQHLASQFQLAVEVTSAKALKVFSDIYVCDHKKYRETSLEKLMGEV